MTINRNHFIAPREREALISLTAITYAEEHKLLNITQIQEAQECLHALFLRTGKETAVLCKLTDMLTAAQRVYRSFMTVSDVVTGASRCVCAIEEKVAALRERVQCVPLGSPARTNLLDPFLSFSQRLNDKLAAIAYRLCAYSNAREQEARAEGLYHIELAARKRWRQHLAGNNAMPASNAENTRNGIVSTFDFGETENTVREAKRATQAVEWELQHQLHDIQTMCQPTSRLSEHERLASSHEAADTLARFRAIVVNFVPLEETVRNLMALYERVHEVFQLDYRKLKRALETMQRDASAYLQAKEESLDPAGNRAKLRKIESLILFIERAAPLATDEAMDAYPTFSRQLSATVYGRRAPWAHIGEDLLRAKMRAETQFSARL